MTEPLGKIERPEAGHYAGRRKVYLVTLVYSAPEAPEAYRQRFDRYWEQVAQQLDNLESGVGRVSHVYHETIAIAGETGLEVMAKLSPPSHQIVTGRCQGGAALEATEDRDLAEECMDWERCLLMGFLSARAARIVSEFYTETMKKRYEHIARCIDESLKADEAGVLFIREGHAVQFPEDIEVFSVVPPALDELHRWRRDQRSEKEEEDKEDKEEEPADGGH